MEPGLFPLGFLTCVLHTWAKTPSRKNLVCKLICRKDLEIGYHLLVHKSNLIFENILFLQLATMNCCLHQGGIQQLLLRADLPANILSLSLFLLFIKLWFLPAEWLDCSPVGSCNTLDKSSAVICKRDNHYK